MRLDSFLNGEIREGDLYSSQVVPEDYRELRDNFPDPYISKRTVELPVASQGIDPLYKLYTPQQLLTAVKIIKEIGKLNDVNTTSLCTLSLLSYVRYNSLLSRAEEDKITPCLYLQINI